MKRALRILAVTIILGIIVLGAIMPIHAQVPVPDSGPYLTQVDVYRHLLEVDDTLVFVRYNNPYDTPPDSSITELFLGRYMNGLTEYGRSSPYAYYDSGYGEGAFSMYLSSADAPVWGGAYSVELLGSPTLDWLGVAATTSMTGAVADDGGVRTNQTTAANNATANDLTLLPATPAVNDAYYFGSDKKFSILTLNVGTTGAGTWAIVWEYYNGSSWTLITGLVDGTSGFTGATGNCDIAFTPPTDWESTSISSVTAYWIRARVSAYAAITTQPLGTQCWINSHATTPIATTSSLYWRATTSITATQALLYTHLIAYAKTLGDAWSVALTTTTASGEVLSSYGETYFTNVVPELRSMCPSLFSASVAPLVYEDRDYRTGAVEPSEWPLDWSGFSTWVGLPEDSDVFKILGAFAIAFLLAGLIVAKYNRTDYALVAGYGTLVAFTAVSWLTPLILGGLTFLAVLLVALIFILGKG